MKIHKIILIALSTACIGILHAEPNPNNPFDVNMVNPAGNQNGPFAPNSIADPIFNGLRQDENQIQYDNTNEVAGREYKSNDATKQGNAGAVAAAITGSALIATGTPMLFSPFLPVVLAGAQLISMGGMELAQVGADSSATGANDAQYQNLMNGSPKLVNMENAQRKMADQIGTPEMRQMLTEHGVDADNFIENLSSGNLQSPTDVLKAIGNNDEFSADDWAQGQSLANSEFGKVSGDLGSPRLQNNEGNDTVAGFGGSGGPLGAGGIGSTGTSKEGGSSSDGTISLPTGASGGRGLLASITESGGTMKMPGTGIDPNAVVANIFGKQADPNAAKGLDAATRNALFSAGVQRPPKGQNIFSLAKRTFRTFHKYRKNNKTRGVKHARS